MRRLLSFILVFLVAILATDFCRAETLVTIENSLDRDETAEIQRFIETVIANKKSETFVATVEKELFDLNRYEAIHCGLMGTQLSCHLKRFNLVGSVAFSGVPLLILENELKKHVPIKTGQVINPKASQFDELLTRAKTAVRAYLERKGYFFAQVDATLSPVSGVPVSDLLISVKGGSFYRVRKVTTDNELPFEKAIVLKPFRQMCANVRFSIESVFQGTKACYDKDIERETISKVEERLADLGYVESHIVVAKDFVSKDTSKKEMDLKVSVHLGPKLITSFEFVNSQVLSLIGIVSFFRSLFGVELFSRALNLVSPLAAFPEDETILSRDLEEALTFKKAHVIDETQINASVEALQEVLRSRGYANASIEVKRQSSRSKWMKIEFLINPREPSAISSIKLAGTDQFSYDKLSDDFSFLIKPRGLFSSGHFTNFALAKDTSVMLAYLRTKGFETAKVSPILEQGNQSSELVYFVEPGAHKRLKQIIFNNDDRKLTKTFLKNNALCPNHSLIKNSNAVGCLNANYSESEIESSRLTLSALYKNAGYLDAEVQSHIEDEDGDVSVSFDIKPEKLTKARIAELLIDGNVITRRNAIVRELGAKAVEAGAELKPLDLEEGLTRLRRYNVFSRLSLENLRKIGSDNEYYLVLQVSEKPTFYIDTTLAYNTDRLFDVGLLMNERNLFGGLLQLKSDFHFGLFIGRLTTFRNSLTWPRFFGTPMNVEFTFPFLLYEAVPTPPILQRHAHFESSIGFEWQFLKKLFPALKFEFRADKWQTDVIGQSFFQNPAASFANLDGLSLVLKEPSSLRGILKPSLSVVSLDDLFDPKNGFKVAGGVELSGSNLGATIPFNVFNFQGSGYKSFGPFTFAANIQLKRGIIQDAADNWWILQNQSDFETLGGIKGPRAYDLGTIGIYGVLRDNQGNAVKDANGNEVSYYHPGNFTLLSTVEVRFPLIEKLFFGKLNGALFSDFGFIGICETNFICFDQNTALDPQGQNRQLGVAVGLGLRYLLPVGPLSIDYGVSPIHEGSGLFGRAARLNFQFGYPF